MAIPYAYAARNLLARRLTTLLTAAGMALVVFVFAGSLMLADGVEKTLSITGHKNQAVVIRKGADGELSSGVDGNLLSLIGAAPGVQRGPDGTPMAVGEIMMVLALDKKGEVNSVSNVVLRGVQERSFAIRPEVKFVEGRAPRPGTDVTSTHSDDLHRESRIGDSLVSHGAPPTRR